MREPSIGGTGAAGPRARLLVADDNARLFDQLVLVLHGEFDVLARAATGLEAVDAAILHTPDVIVLDISMPVMSGLRAAQQLRARGCRSPVVFLTVHEDEEYLRAAQEAGGLGYVLKSRMASDLVPALRAALQGLPFVSQPLPN
ncbi:MAG: degU 1 [Acidobacteria bacterium]|nr:degU 1 [Acidobacteriota bacterium]